MVLAGIAAAASAYNTDQTAKHADHVAADGIRRNSALQEDTNKRLNKTISDARKSTPDDERKTAQAQYLQTVRSQLGQANSGLAAKGLSSQFDQLAGQEAGQTKDFGDTLSGLMARMDAPVLQRQREGNTYGNLGMDMTRIGSDMSGNDFLTRLRASNVRRNPWIDLAASSINGAASNYGGGSSGGGSGAASPYSNYGGATYSANNYGPG
jgi:hypothetical protein